ncbi:hypothetical protein [Lacrimispora saccharolytica]|uniref:hypothetical protein n=1 Tax=Lacrimispora saccharolytica TaxID=84030 RepID=UPI00265CACF1|nr:hypothetical protein [Lacrimispora saccharolytica]MCF2656994.1 hypothetical protein [Lacrimispora saccharolytica]
MIFVGIVVGFMIGTIITGYLCNDILKNNNTTMYKDYFIFVCRWLKKKQEGANLFSWFERRGMKKICLYGLGDIGQLLISEVKDSNLEIVCVIDKAYKGDTYEFPVYRLKDIDKVSEEFDVIVVTPFYYRNVISNQLSDYFDCEIVFINEVI